MFIFFIIFFFYKGTTCTGQALFFFFFCTVRCTVCVHLESYFFVLLQVLNLLLLVKNANSDVFMYSTITVMKQNVRFPSSF